MRKPIKILEDLTINKIAAGEVIDAPHSIVKELMENSIDANAKNIVIEIKEGGSKYIRVSDNGIGIYEEDVETAFMRHATSKITLAKDLTSINTLGFRGEALASITSVSQTQIITKPKEQIYGISLDINGGKIINSKKVGAPDGTTVTVENLFFNMPARIQFLKSAQVEATRVGEVVSRLALSQPDISIQYINNNNIMFTTPGNGNIEHTILSVLGKELVENLLAVNNEQDMIRVKGFISKPTYVRGNRKFEIIFVNNRYVKSKLIYRAIEDAYREKLTINKFPACILNIMINPELLDVNIHPTKAEIKIHNEDQVYKLIYDTIVTTLREKVVIPPLIINHDRILYRGKIKENNTSYDTYNNKNYNNSHVDGISDDIVKIEGTDDKVFCKNILNNSNIMDKNQINLGITQKNFLENLLHNFKVIGQLFNTYIIIEQNFSMILIDQHAAHERLLYNQMLKGFREESIVSQALLEPKVLQLSSDDYTIVVQHLRELKKLGFVIENFGVNTLLVREVPIIMGIPKNLNFFYESIDEIKEKSSRDSAFIETIIKRSCRTAIKASDKLNLYEIEQLIEDLCKLQPPLTCPHGRPILISLTKYEIEKNFKRIQ